MSTSLRKVIEHTYEEGRVIYSTFRKVSSIASTSGYWVDLSMTTGSPTPNFYIGGEREATVPTDWYKKGIWHSGNVSPAKKYLHKMALLGTTAVFSPAPFILCDYLMYYPLIDMDSTDEQLLTNTTATLPRYTSGEGVRAFLVATNPYVGGATFQMSYTNSDGISGRVSRITLTNTSTYIGTIVNSHTAGLSNFGTFIELQAGDRGIRSVESITFFAPNGGLACLVLVRPIANITTRELTAWAEYDFLKDKPSFPRIYDGAYLNLLCMPSGTIATVPLLGEATFIFDT
jgi:hypothetical protein